MSCVPNAPLVSVGIPTHNRPQGMARTLAMIQSQTHTNLEIIVSDNASPDPAVLEVMLRAVYADPRVTYYRQLDNLGGLPNFQFVLSKASGEYFLWACDDDEWNPRFIETCLAGADGAATVMTGMETHWLASGRRERGVTPELDPDRSAAANLEVFLNMLTPRIFYGLHRTETIRHVLLGREFAFYDCAFVARQILGGGVRTISPVLYAAGVDEAVHQIKHRDPSRTHLLYGPFLRALMRMILAAGTLTPLDKLRLSRQALAAVLGQIRHHEKVSRPGLLLLSQLGAEAVQWIRGGCHQPVALIRETTENHGKESFAQCGEDLIVGFIFQALRIPHFTYLDIGAHHPSRFSNTYRFYLQGMRGVCVEPDPELFAVLKAGRPGDRLVNVGISAADQEGLPFFILSTPTLNTFCKEEALRLVTTGTHAITRIARVPTISMPSLLARYFPDKAPDFLSVDVEGLDLQVLQGIDLTCYRPKVICVETLSYSEQRQETKENKIRELLEGAGYFLYADTYVNSIFVDVVAWRDSA